MSSFRSDAHGTPLRLRSQNRSRMRPRKHRFVIGREINQTLYPVDVVRRSLDRGYGERVGEEESIFYWPGWRDVEEDGTIILKARGYDQSGAHWTGWVEIGPDHADFALWHWIIARRGSPR